MPISLHPDIVALSQEIGLAVGSAVVGIDYDDGLYRVYAEGRALSPAAHLAWMDVLVGYAPPKRPLVVLDLGSGTGRFSPTLADTFGGPVFGVEPSTGMREVANVTNAHPNVAYLEGQAENIPLAHDACDVAFMYLVLHHVEDRAAATAELARVVRPGGMVFVRTSFGDQIGPDKLYDYFPRMRELHRDIFPTLPQTQSEFVSAGFEVEALASVRFEVAATLADYYARVEQRAISTFELMSEEEIVAGLEAMRRDAGTAGDEPITESGDLLVLRLGVK